MIHFTIMFGKDRFNYFLIGNWMLHTLADCTIQGQMGIMLQNVMAIHIF